jgi:CheY-like chemotaxis protein
MEQRVLVATPTAGFGELIRQTLEDTGYCQCTVVTSAQEALGVAAGKPFSLAIIDADLDVQVLPGLISTLQNKAPALRLILIPPEDDPHNTGLSDLEPHGLLNKPFYLPDLLDTVQGVLEMDFILDNFPPPDEVLTTRPANTWLPEFADRQQPAGTNKRQASNVPDWLANTGEVNQRLARVAGESNAWAALIVRDDQLWAYNRNLTLQDAQRLAQTLTQHWGRGSEVDLARYVLLEATGREYLLYATGLGWEYILALIFDAEMPFSRIRKQVAHMARSLAAAELPKAHNLDLGSS